MKKLFLLMLLCPVVLPAQITISGFSVKPGTPSTVTFTVSWNKTSVDSAWVFVDYNKSGTMTRLELSGATLTPSSSPGKAYMVSGNDQGAWVVAGAAGNFAAEVKLLTATATANFPGACVYAIDYPPVGKYTAADKITFTGTPPFYLEFVGDTPATVSTKDAQGLYSHTLGSNTPASFTDASKAPGVITPATFTLNASAQSYCEGVAGVSFSLTGTHRGVQYLLIKDNNYASPVATLSGTGSAATFSGTFPPGVYSAKTVPTAVFREVAMAAVSVTIYPLGTDGQPSSPCGCADGTADCSGTCTTKRTYTQNDGSCTGACTKAYIRQFNQCGSMVNSQYSTYSKYDCTSGCPTFPVSSTGGVSKSYARSTYAWTVGTLTWSDRIIVSVCPSSSTFSNMLEGKPIQYTFIAGLTFYNGTCVSNYASSMCPTGWQVPKEEHIKYLLDFTHSDYRTVGALLHDQWSTYYHWYQSGPNSSSEFIMTRRIADYKVPVLLYRPDAAFLSATDAYSYGGTVRCVK